MSAEPFSISAALKYVWVVVIIPAYIFLFKRQEKIKDTTYTKKETDAAISNKVAPILVELKYSQTARVENTAAMKDLSTAVVDLKVQMAKQGKQ